MLKRIILPLILIILAYGFWVSPDFKEISAGVAIFLFGMLSLEEGFKAFSGGTLEKVLQKSTDKLYKSIGFGIISTTIMQSSSLVSVLTISFLGAGLIGLAQGIGIVFGANIGTTTGAWLIAGFGLKVHISAYAMPMLVFGVILIFQKSKSLKGIGYILAGLGFLFLGIHYMKDGFEAFKDTIDLASLGGTGIKYLFIFTGIGIFSTVVMQSSHATLTLILTALSVGQISYENALALAIGANVGTTITAIIGSMSSNIIGKRLAGAHLIFNLVTGIIAIIFMNQIMAMVDIVSINVGISDTDYTLKLAVFHTIFNIIGVIVMVPFINRLVVFLESVLKNTDFQDTDKDNAKYLNDSVLELPSTAMKAIVNETKHLYENAFEIIIHGLNIKRSNITSTKSLNDVIKESYSNNAINIDEFYQFKIKGIYGEIIDFSTKAQSDMPTEYIEQLYKLKLANRDIVEAVKNTKHLQKNLVKYANNANKHIKLQYDNIRLGLAELLRVIDLIAHTQEEDKILLLLSKVKVNTKKYDVIMNSTLNNLIRKDLITNEMATSLMNDSVYAYNISKNFMEMANIIFYNEGSDIKNIGNEINMDDEDVQVLLKIKD
jgi:phosphate:Na+ symporter